MPAPCRRHGRSRRHRDCGLRLRSGRSPRARSCGRRSSAQRPCAARDASRTPVVRREGTDDPGGSDGDHKIIGTTMPVLEIGLEPGESVVAEGGELSWMTESVELHTASNKAGAKGVFGAIKRGFAGGTLFMTEYTAQSARGMVAFATKVPGHIMPLQLDGNTTYMVHKHGYLCGVPSVNLEIGFQQKLGAAVFGGEGFILQKVTGTGE